MNFNAKVKQSPLQKVKVRGQRADLTEIQKKTAEALSDFVSQACVLAVHPKQPTQRIVAFVTLKQDQGSQVSWLIECLHHK